MSYQTVIAGLVERLKTVDGLKLVLDHEPPSIQRLPALLLYLDSFRRSYSGNVVTMRYRVKARLLISWVSNEAAERELLPFVNTIPAAIDADMFLGGRIQSGGAEVEQDTDHVAAWTEYGGTGGTMYRSLEIFISVVEKGSYKSGI